MEDVKTLKNDNILKLINIHKLMFVWRDTTILFYILL